MLGAGSGRTQRAVLARAHVRVDEQAATSLHITWQAVRGADDYEVTTTPACTVQRDVGATRAKLVDLLPNHEYTISVRAISASARGPWHSTRATTSQQQKQTTVAGELALRPVTTACCCEFALQECSSTRAYGCMDASGVDVSGKRYRFATFSAGELHAATGATLQLLGSVGEWWLDASNMIVDAVLHVRVGAGPWLDANRLHVPLAQGAHTDGWACALMSQTPEVRRITFGGRVMHGQVLARVGLCQDNRRLAGIRCT